MNSTPKNFFFSKIETRDDALMIIKRAAYSFWIVAAIQGCIGIFSLPSMLVDAALYTILAGILMKWESRVAAVLLALLSMVALIVTALNFVGMRHYGGNNIVLAVIMAFIAIRAIDATFKLHGRFRLDGEKPSPKAEI